jgi:competence protein ComEA
MPNRRPTSAHQEAVSRRLALLSAELAAARPDPPSVPPPLQPEEAVADDWLDGHTRIRPLAVEPDRTSRPAAAPAPVIPVPGRHASRRVGRRWADAVPTTLRGRVALGPAQLAIVAVLVAVGLAVTCWWVVRGDAGRVEAPTVTMSTGSPGADSPMADAPLSDASPVAASASADAGTVTVDVAGKVRRPGIAVLDAGSRVVDALHAAGGARHGVDLSGLNLARVLVDGEQIVVGEPAPTGLAASTMATPGASGGPLVNLNTASQDELEALPEVGPVTAQAILSWRAEHGGFTSVDELLEVDGIGDATLGQLAPFVTV